MIKIYINLINNTLFTFCQKNQTAKKIEELVNKILEIKNVATIKDGQNNTNNKKRRSEIAPTTDTSHLEKQIDELVFGLYGLGEEEIGVVVG